MRIFFPIHLDGGNRGCEAIAKGTAILLQEKKENLIGLCSDTDLDKFLCIDDYVTLKRFPQKSLLFRIYRKIIFLITKDLEIRKSITYKHDYQRFLKSMSRTDIMLSTGGDMMCYQNNQTIFTVNYAKQRGVKSILWGCSIGENNLTPTKIEALKNFNMIYARETLTKVMLNQHGFNNVVVFPDPAFILNPEACTLPECFSSSEVIGLNISNFVIGGFELDTPFAKEIIKMVEYILSEAQFHILLIPHVMWKDQDDRVVSKKLRDYLGSDRISILDSEKLNYCQIRYVISKCNIFIGARTHAVISAYSTSVPAIALGYSIKSKGIAKDVGMPDWSVVDSKNIKKNSLLDAFLKMRKEERQIKDMILLNMNSYKQKTYGILDEVYKVCYKCK